MREKFSVQLTSWVTKSQKKLIQQKAKKLQISESEVIRHLLDNYLANEISL